MSQQIVSTWLRSHIFLGVILNERAMHQRFFRYLFCIFSSLDPLGACLNEEEENSAYSIAFQLYTPAIDLFLKEEYTPITA